MVNQYSATIIAKSVKNIPHEIVEASYFDPETDSIVFVCRDATVNYFNPYILVFCRHNHDIKCILSGKAAKAAMFYITDYITKMDLKTYEMLSLLSHAVSQMPDASKPCSSIDNAKILLHKCLSQFSRQQQIHAQQAAWYLRGKGDSISSHNTIPMMSGLMLAYVNENYLQGTSQTHDDDDDSDDDDVVQPSLRIAIDKEGRLMEANQVHDYVYRGDSLKDMTFYDFCRCIKRESLSRRQPINTSETRLGVLQRHILHPLHPLHDTHILVQHTDCERGKGINEKVPCVFGTSIPCQNSGLKYSIFALSHFCPFSHSDPLIQVKLLQRL